MKTISTDLAILGGGLAGGLIALAMRKRRPEINLLLIEQGAFLGGNHLWSYFASDIAPEHRWLMAPLICHGWTGYDVRFPDYNRHFDTGYYSVESERLDEVVRAALPPAQIMTGVKALAANPKAIVLDNGTRIEAKGVIDTRGGGNPNHLDCGWQSFLGQMLHLAEPHDLAQPMIMDATVEQLDGFRFVYCLPVSPVEVFVEDTYYLDSPDVNLDALEARIDAYAARQRWQVERKSRTETGMLPVVMAGDFDGYWRSSGDKTAKAGARAGLFHPLTSYSLPDAVRFAVQLTGVGNFDGEALADITYDYARQHWKAMGYYRMLTKMMFRAALPAQRFRPLQHTYSLDADLIQRFYAGKSTLQDKARILIGKPPVPIHRAIMAIAR